MKKGSVGPSRHASTVRWLQDAGRLSELDVPPRSITRAEIVEGIHRYAVSRWHQLSPLNQLELGFGLPPEEQSQEHALACITWLLMDCVNLTADRAVQVKNRRLDDDEY